ncbi:hypothetical protein [Streptomyces meridianus]|uniref:Secreted protein n=1 Tax=Streptomyces meridianus TaxID=2938945 RepID=A0ABT0WZT5_9ACTN|nr:hypothetical protein [Streptomyces meridianus]MCM2575832.1 hypothetical protein [Streptomyces meridianus]
MPVRRRSTGIAALAAAALILPAAVGCSAISTALDCARTAATIADNVDQLQQAVSGAQENPAEAQQALDRIDKNLDELGDSTGDADLKKAVGDMNTGVQNVRESLSKGENPDLTPVENSASEITNICTPG